MGNSLRLILFSLAILVLIGFKEGDWIKPLKIIGFYIVSVVVLAVVTHVLNLSFEVKNILELILAGGFTIGLLMYCFWMGYLKNRFE